MAEPEDHPSLWVEAIEGVSVIRALGDLDPAGVEALVERIQRCGELGPVVVDLSEVTLVAPRPVRRITRALAQSCPPHQRALVCRRGSARVLVRTWQLAHSISLFMSVGDALQARRFERSGYGPGWHAAAPLRRRLPPARRDARRDSNP